jgi:hypothetical protein
MRGPARCTPPDSGAEQGDAQGVLVASRGIFALFSTDEEAHID